MNFQGVLKLFFFCAFCFGVGLNMSLAERVSFASYNVGLAEGFVAHRKQRLRPLIEAIKKRRPDVLCLQEVWAKKDRKKILRELKAYYPHSHFVDLRNVKASRAPVCRPKQIFGKGRFITCFRSQCKGLEGKAFTDCVLVKCKKPIEYLKTHNRECAQAIFAQVGKNPVFAILSLLNPFWKAKLFAYQGQVGLMILSQYPLIRVGFRDLKEVSTTIRRGILHADIKIGDKKFFVGCTHLTANLSQSVPYTGNQFKSWEQENFVQAKKIIEVVDAWGEKSPQVIMGDFNCSKQFRSRKISEDFPKSCLYFESKKFKDDLFKNGPKCTFCQNNTLVKDEKNYLIDHIYTRYFGKAIKRGESQIIFTQKVPLKVKEKVVKSHLSDHFGVETPVFIP